MTSTNISTDKGKEVIGSTSTDLEMTNKNNNNSKYNINRILKGSYVDSVKHEYMLSNYLKAHPIKITPHTIKRQLMESDYLFEGELGGELIVYPPLDDMRAWFHEGTAMHPRIRLSVDFQEGFLATIALRTKDMCGIYISLGLCQVLIRITKIIRLTNDEIPHPDHPGQKSVPHSITRSDISKISIFGDHLHRAVKTILKNLGNNSPWLKPFLLNIEQEPFWDPTTGSQVPFSKNIWKARIAMSDTDAYIFKSLSPDSNPRRLLTVPDDVALAVHQNWKPPYGRCLGWIFPGSELEFKFSVEAFVAGDECTDINPIESVVMKNGIWVSNRNYLYIEYTGYVPRRSLVMRDTKGNRWEFTKHHATLNGKTITKGINFPLGVLNLGDHKNGLPLYTIDREELWIIGNVLSTLKSHVYYFDSVFGEVKAMTKDGDKATAAEMDAQITISTF